MDAATATPRARAAWAFSGLDQEPLAEKAGLKYSRVRAILSRQDHSAVTLDELYKIADAADVPRPFMDDGFVVADQALQNRVSDLEARLGKLELEVDTHALEAHKQPAVTAKPSRRAPNQQQP